MSETDIESITGDSKELSLEDQIARVIETQCSDGNWNYDAYMHGMANGMILIQSIVTGKSPTFLEAPEQWIYDNRSEIKDAEAVAD